MPSPQKNSGSGLIGGNQKVAKSDQFEFIFKLDNSK
jgi:hypothetical protein